MFWKAKDSIKGKSYVLSGYKQINKVCLLFLDGKLENIATIAAFSSWNVRKSWKKNKLGDTKTTNKIPLMFVDVKELTERYRRNKK